MFDTKTIWEHMADANADMTEANRLYLVAAHDHDRALMDEASGKHREALATWEKWRVLSIPLKYEYRITDNNYPQYPAVETFWADSDDEANAYAEAHYPELEWYILNGSGENING